MIREMAERALGGRIIVDRHQQLNHPAIQPCGLNVSISKEEAARRHVFAEDTQPGTFVDFGSGEADLNYLLGVTGNLHFDQAAYDANKILFDAKFKYAGLDWNVGPNIDIVADACDPRLMEKRPDLRSSASVIYSNNVFEHLKKPWIAARNAADMLVPGGLCVIIVPFAIRYHEVPGDYFRFTHTGVESLFEDTGDFTVLESGYDLTGRRNDWQGSGVHNDSVPVDEFGAWRETWFTFVALRKKTL